MRAMKRYGDVLRNARANDSRRGSRLRSGALSCAAALGLLLVAGVQPTAGAESGEEHVLRFATMAPKSRRLAVEAGRWKERVSRATGGRVKVVVYWGGGAGDEKAIVRKMRMGQFDAAALSTIALSAYIKQVQVLNAPLTIESYAQLDAVLEELSDDFDREAYQNGMKLLGWGDIGKLRMFSKKPIRSLADLRRTRPWLYKEVLMGREFFNLIGVAPVPLSIPEVYGALATGMVDVVFSSALGALVTLWFTQTPYVTREGAGYIAGAFAITRKKWDLFPPDVQDAFVNMSLKYRTAIVNLLRKADRMALDRMLKRGVTAVELEDRPEWLKVAATLKQRFVGRFYSREILERVGRICAKHRAPASRQPAR